MWDPDVLARMEQLWLAARVRVAGLLQGAHASVRTGPSVEFAEYKDYAPGDPVRDLDWKVLARSDRLVVRRHQAETEFASVLVLDASGDLSTGEAGRRGRPPLDGTKWGYAAVATATAAAWLARRGEPVGLAVVGGADVPWRWLPPRRGRAHLARLVGVLASTRPAGRADLARAFVELGARMDRRCLVLVVSDLMEEPAAWGPAAGALALRRDVRVLHLHDPREWALDYRRPARFRSPEGGRPLEVDPEGARALMAEVVAEYLAEVRARLAPHGIRHVLAATDEPMERPLAALLGAASPQPAPPTPRRQG